MELRPYQNAMKCSIGEAWSSGVRNVLAVLPTGAGKTVVFSNIIHSHPGAVCAIAHRQELVSQISLALARDGVKHRIIGPKPVVKLCVNIHMHEVGRSFYHPDAVVAVAGVDTLVKRGDSLKGWANSVTLWVQDEAHHLLRANKWGTAAAMFPNAKGLGVTATPLRADGKGLGAHADGLFNTMIEGPTMRPLIEQGYLTDYRIFAPPSDLNLDDVNITAGGDYNRQGLKHAVRRSRVVGDVVAHYLKIAGGKLGVTFATDVETATDIAAQFNAAGVPAHIVHAKTPNSERTEVLRRFKRRELLQLVNVDLFGEGFDLPSIEVCSMARPTQSYGLYVQQFGRALRPLEGKDKAIIIDHVGNVTRHGLPDSPRIWTLDRREKRRTSATDAIPVRTCLECFAVYERTLPACPFCGRVPVPQSRSGPEFVDGDLCELDAHALALLRGEIAKVDLDPEVRRMELVRRNVPAVGVLSHVKRHAARQVAQTALREAIALWAGHQRAALRPDPESYKRFYFMFGIDVLSAQALGTTEAAQLTESVRSKI
jgi:DNA repair protein RadD